MVSNPFTKFFVIFYPPAHPLQFQDLKSLLSLSPKSHKMKRTGILFLFLLSSSKMTHYFESPCQCHVSLSLSLSLSLNTPLRLRYNVTYLLCSLIFTSSFCQLSFNPFFFKHHYWSIIALQCCVSFCYITK